MTFEEERENRRDKLGGRLVRVREAIPGSRLHNRYLHPDGSDLKLCFRNRRRISEATPVHPGGTRGEGGNAR